MAPNLLLLLLWISYPAHAGDPHTALPPKEEGRVKDDPPALVPIAPARADAILRASCQRCHDNARVALVESKQPVLPAIRRSARFNMQPMNFIENRAQRARILRAIETGGMPFADEFVVPPPTGNAAPERIARHTFLDSAEGRALLAWLREPPPR